MKAAYSRNKINWITTAAIVVANMIGTGVFTTLGLQMLDLKNSWTILSAWVIGGIIALLGAFSYSELGSRYPQSGGEYNFLTKIFHPFLGYLSGWVSLTVGFGAPIALAAMAMGAYIGNYFSIPGKQVAIFAILLVSVIHSFNNRQSSFFQNSLTLFKILIIVVLIIYGFYLPVSDNAFDWSSGWKQEIGTAAFVTSLVYVSYAFSGWNAAAYIAGEVRYPKRNLPKALISASLLISILFVLLQAAFLNQATFDQLSGKIDVGSVVATVMFGKKGGMFVSLLIAFLLIASISSMIWVGPRVTRAMANDYAIWQFFSKDNKWGVPVRAIWLQTFISILLIATSSFEQVLLYSGFILQLFTALSVGGIFILRFRQKGKGKHFKSPGYPWVQIIYLVFSALVLGYLLIDKPRESLLGLMNLLAGAISYWWSMRFIREQKS